MARSLQHVSLIVAGTLVVTLPAFARSNLIEKADLSYAIAVPSECRLDEGPGTLEAICAPDFDEAKSVELPAAQALLLEVDAERIPADAPAYAETEFRKELPEAVCGAEDDPKVKIGAVSVVKDGDVTTFTATVTCPEIKFLGLAERTASARYVTTPAFRYRLMARSLTADAGAVKAAAEAFLASFKQLEAKK